MASWPHDAAVDDDAMTKPTDESRDHQAVVKELATHAAELSGLLHETASMLAEACEESGAVEDGGSRQAADEGGRLGREVLEIATLHAQAAGVSVADWLREAVLAYAAGARPGPRTGERGERASTP